MQLSQNNLTNKTQNAKNYLAVFISLITCAIYLFSLRNDFVLWDDNDYVIDNPYIRSFDLTFLKWALSSFYASNWHPLTWISHAIDYAVWGLNPLGHHLTSIILHSVNTFLVTVLCMRLMGLWGQRTLSVRSSTLLDDRGLMLAAGITGLLFGLHPVHVESVAWVAERKDLLCALFFLLSIMMYTEYVSVTNDKPSHENTKPRFLMKQYLFALGFFALSLLSKPMAVSLPLVLLILDWYPFKRIESIKSFRSAFAEKLPFLFLSLMSSMLTILAQKTGGTMQYGEVFPLPTKMLVAAKSLVAYLWDMMLPIKLVPYYPYPEDASLLSPRYFLSVLLVLGITAGCIIAAKRQKIWLSFWSYYAITLFPVLGIVQVGAQSMADRYTYLPSISPFLLIGLGAAWGFQKTEALKKNITMIGIFFAVLLFLSLSYLTVKQIGIWKNSIVLWSYVIEKEPESRSFALLNRGMAFAIMGRQDKALEDYDKAISLDPSDFRLVSNRGEVYMRLGQLDKAALDFDKAMTLYPGHPRAYMNYVYLGIGYGWRGNQDKAMEFYNKAIVIEPNRPTAYVNRGIAYTTAGQYDKALEDFNKAIMLDPYSGEAYAGRGNLYMIMGKKELAASDFQRVDNLRIPTTR